MLQGDHRDQWTRVDELKVESWKVEAEGGQDASGANLPESGRVSGAYRGSCQDGLDNDNEGRLRQGICAQRLSSAVTR